MRRHSFFWKLFAGNLLLIGTIVAVAGGLSYRHLKANYLRQTESSQLQTTRMAKQFFERVWPLTPAQIDGATGALLSGSPMRLTVIASDGCVLAESWTDAGAMSPHLTASRPEIAQALAGNVGRHVRNSQTLGTEFRYVAMLIRHQGQDVGVVRVAMPVRAVAEGQALIRNALLWSVPAAGAAAAALAGLLSWIWYAPLRQSNNKTLYVKDYFRYILNYPINACELMVNA